MSQQQQVLCLECGAVKDADTGFAPAQLKKKRPKCRTCTGGGDAKMHSQSTGGRRSKLENERAQTLALWQQMGAIRELQEQVRYPLIPGYPKDALDPESRSERPASYTADFVYIDVATGRTIVEDTKGWRTEAYTIRRKLMRQVHGISVHEISADNPRRRLQFHNRKGES
jgi:hypothetical protein